MVISEDFFFDFLFFCENTEFVSFVYASLDAVLLKLFLLVILALFLTFVMMILL